MGLLFDAETPEEEQSFGEILEGCCAVLAQVRDGAEEQTVEVHRGTGRLMVWMCEIGAAPDGFWLNEPLLTVLQNKSVARIGMSPEVAGNVLETLKIGILRHQLGVEEADGFVLH